MKNKTPLFMAAIVGLALVGVFLSESSNAYTLHDTTEVGDVDSFLYSAAKVGSPDSEALWVQGVLGDASIDWSVSVENVAYEETTTTGIWAFELSSKPEYWLLKNSNQMALFANVASLDWGVFDASLLSAGLNVPTDPWIISHVTELSGDGSTNTNVNNVPAPEAFFLFASGLGLLGFSRTGKKPSS